MTGVQTCALPISGLGLGLYNRYIAVGHGFSRPMIDVLSYHLFALKCALDVFGVYNSL